MTNFFAASFLLLTTCAQSVHGFAPYDARPTMNLLRKGRSSGDFQLFESRSDKRVGTVTRPVVDDLLTKKFASIGAAAPLVKEETQSETEESGFNYGDFAKKYPFSNNVAIASTKTAAADLIAQVVIAHTPIANIDYERSLLFFTFGAVYSGAFQYFYQVNIFKKLFDVDAFTSQPWVDKLKDEEGLKALAAQTALDLVVLTLIYLPTFYIFKAGLASGSMDPSVWASSGIDTYTTNFAKDEFDLIRVWLPADLVCFSVPLYLRLPVRHVVSFGWTAYLSFARGGH